MSSTGPTPASRWTTLLGSAGVVLVLALAGWSAARPLAHDDLFFHLRTGRLIAETGHVPTTDPFSHTIPGAPWTSHEWGFALIVDQVYGLAGLNGLVALGSLLVVACFAVLNLLLRQLLGPERTALRVCLLVLGVVAAERAMFIVRAALFSTLALTTLQYLLHRHYTARHRRATACAIVLLMWVWANVHVGAVFGLAVLGAYCAQGVVDVLARRAALGLAAVAREALLPRLGLLLVCAGVTLLNPSGLGLWSFAVELNELYYGSGVSWTMGMFGPPSLQRHPFFFLTVVCCLLACLPLRRAIDAIRSTERPGLLQTLCMLTFLVLALRSMRFIPDFVQFALPFCAMIWSRDDARADVPRPRTDTRDRPALQGLAAMMIAGATAWLQPALPHDPLPAYFPTRLATFMERERVQGTMFNGENWGGYLGWRLQTPVYWDGRNDVYGALAKEFAATPDRAVLVQRHKLDMLALSRGYHERFAAFLQAHAADWGCVYFDDEAALYVKRGARFDALLASRKYRLLRPFGVPSDAAVAQVARVPRVRALLEQDLRQLHTDAGPTEVERLVRRSLARADQGR